MPLTVPTPGKLPAGATPEVRDALQAVAERFHAAASDLCAISRELRENAKRVANECHGVRAELNRVGARWARSGEAKADLRRMLERFDGPIRAAFGRMELVNRTYAMVAEALSAMPAEFFADTWEPALWHYWTANNGWMVCEPEMAVQAHLAGYRVGLVSARYAVSLSASTADQNVQVSFPEFVLPGREADLFGNRPKVEKRRWPLPPPPLTAAGADGMTTTECRAARAGADEMRTTDENDETPQHRSDVHLPQVWPADAGHRADPRRDGPEPAAETESRVPPLR